GRPCGRGHGDRPPDQPWPRGRRDCIVGEPALCEDQPMEREIRNISTRIDAPPERVYEVARDPYNLPRWAPSFFRAVERVGNDWVVQSPLGRARLEFAPLNEEGVLDHTLQLDSGETFVNHMRVVPSGDGSEISFALARRWN